MDAAALLDLGARFGAMGLMIGYLVWKDLRRDKLDAARIDADKALATSLALLEAAMKGRR